MSDKQFCKKADLLQLLVTNKNVDPNTLPPTIFDKKTYASLITPYTCLVANGIDSLTSKKTYDNPVNFSLYLECNVIDASISQCLYSYISAFEKRFRSFVIETICSKMYDDGDTQCLDVTKIQGYLSGNPLFDFIDFNSTPSLDSKRRTANAISNEELKNIELSEIANVEGNVLSKRTSSFNSLIDCVNISKNKKTSLEKHYIQKYGFIPLYIGMHSLTFGEILSIYSVFSISDKNRFMQGYYRNNSHIFSENDAFKFESRIKRINDIRNVVAHNEPIFPLITNDKRIASLTSVFEKLKVNYNDSVCKPIGTFAIPKFSLVTKNSFNEQCFDNIEKAIDSLNT